MAKSKNKYEKFEGYQDPLCDKSVLLDARGARRTQSLFVDTNHKDKYEPLYTMRESDHKGFISAYQIYMHSTDEYEAAMKLVGSMDHWKKLCSLKWFTEGGVGFSGVKQWRRDVINRDKSYAKKALIEQVRLFKDSAAATKLQNWSKTQEYDDPELKKPVGCAKNRQDKKNGKLQNKPDNDKIAHLHKLMNKQRD
jgi:hypothetical protein